MALVPSDPKQQRAVFVIAAALLAFAGVYMYVYTPDMEEVAATQTRVDELERSNREARLTAARGGGNIEEQLAVYQRHVMRLEELIPAQGEVSGLISTITAEGRRLNVEVAELTPEADEPGTYYTRQSYSIRAIGEYHNIARFLTAIASLPRIITPVELDLTPFDDTDGLYNFQNPVVATFVIETYILPEGGQGPPPAEVGTGGAP